MKKLTYIAEAKNAVQKITMRQKTSDIKIPLKSRGHAASVKSANINLTLRGTIFPDNIEEATDPIFDQFVVVAYGWRQYADGNGTSYWSDAFIDKTTEQGFNSKGEARAFAKLHNIKSYHKKGRGNVGYGDVGAEHQVMKIVTIREVVYTESETYVYYGIGRISEFTGK